MLARKMHQFFVAYPLQEEIDRFYSSIIHFWTLQPNQDKDQSTSLSRKVGMKWRKIKKLNLRLRCQAKKLSVLFIGWDISGDWSYCVQEWREIEQWAPTLWCRIEVTPLPWLLAKLYMCVCFTWYQRVRSLILDCVYVPVVILVTWPPFCRNNDIRPHIKRRSR